MQFRISLLVSINILAILALLAWGQAFAETEKLFQGKHARVMHGAGTPTPLSGYILPFNRKFISRITNGPGEGLHINSSSEAIDFDPVGNWDNPYDSDYREVRTAKRGWVYINGTYQDWGKLLIIRHADGFYTYYAHLNAVSPGLSPGTLVRKKQVIGVVGKTGCEYNNPPCGEHLHVEARDQMTPTPSTNSAYHGSSRRHSLRRMLGIGWGPWYPEVLNVQTLNSGLTVSSTSHVVQKCSGNSQIVSRWPGADDEFNDVNNNAHQLNGFSYAWNATPDHVPDITPEASHGAYYAVRPGLQLGPNPDNPIFYYFHLRMRSSNHGWASAEEVAHIGPYKLAAGCSTSPSQEDWADAPSEADP